MYVGKAECVSREREGVDFYREDIERDTFDVRRKGGGGYKSVTDQPAAAHYIFFPLDLARTNTLRDIYPPHDESEGREASWGVCAQAI